MSWRGVSIDSWVHFKRLYLPSEWWLQACKYHLSHIIKSCYSCLEWVSSHAYGKVSKEPWVHTASSNQIPNVSIFDSHPRIYSQACLSLTIFSRIIQSSEMMDSVTYSLHHCLLLLPIWYLDNTNRSSTICSSKDSTHFTSTALCCKTGYSLYKLGVRFMIPFPSFLFLLQSWVGVSVFDLSMESWLLRWEIGWC